MRRLSFKVPIVVRYSVGLSIIFGILHATFARNIRWVTRYVVASPAAMLCLCHQELDYYLYISKYITSPFFEYTQQNLCQDSLSLTGIVN